MKTMNQWNKLSDFFDVKVSGDEIQGGAMDNILIAWPPILNLIKEYFPEREGLKALDFGCGVGEFCIKLDKLGFKVIGFDSSSGMINKARSYVSKDIELFKGSISELGKSGKYDLITSIQAFQFIDDIINTIEQLDSLLKPGGLFIFATFNPQFVINCINENVLLVDFDSTDNPKKGFMQLGDDIRIPTFIRNAKEYEKIFAKFNYKKILEDYPPLTKSFLEKYPLRVPPDKLAPSKDPEHLIMGFKKIF